jgi:Short C-terminal domain
VKEIKDYVEGRIASASHGVMTAPAASKPDELKKLADLKSEGILTAEEFESEKARLLQS